MIQIKTSDSLCVEDVPFPESSWRETCRFALSFSGYEWAGGTHQLADVAEVAKALFLKKDLDALAKLPLDVLRASLFFEQRKFNHFGYPPEGADFAYFTNSCARYVKY